MEHQVTDHGQSLNDIQNYLANFNKEISAGGTPGQTYILAAPSDGVVGQANAGGASFVVATHAGEQLYDGAALLQGVGEEALTIPKTEQMADTEPKMKIEGGLPASQEALDDSLLNSSSNGNLFTPIHIAPSQTQTAQSSTEPLFTVHAAAMTDDTSLPESTGVVPATGEVISNAAIQPQIMTLQHEQDATPGRPQVVAMTQNGQQLVSMATEEPEGDGVDGDMGTEGEEDGEIDGQDEEGGQAGEGSYQTVTIVPSEVNQGGEVSYVLIVSQNDQDQKIAGIAAGPGDDGDEDLGDMSVYDFKEESNLSKVAAATNAAAATTTAEVITEDGTKKLVKVTPKKQAPMLTSQLMCNYCNYTSPKRYLLTRHMKTHSEERPHKCHICDRGFKTVASLQNHINTHTGVRPHKCKECDAAFTTSGELVRHVRYRHTYEKPHKCPECDYASVELSKLKRHMRSHTGERPYQCPHCSYASPDTYKLKRHLRIHTGEKPYECEICHTRFTQSNSLKAHKLIHTGNKPVYQCELCPTTCGRKTDLKIHVQKLHTSDKPLMCKKCGKSFPDRYTWKIHVKTHEGEKCFKCELCPYAALSQRHLESHLLTHTGEKPFECQDCDQTFRQKQLLKRHRNLYHTPDYIPPAPKDKVHQCGECGKAFAHKGNLLRHRAGHDPENEEYQEALANYKLERGEAYEEEAEEEEAEEMEEHELDESGPEQVLVTQAVIGDGQNFQAQATGQIHMANINGQQVQLQLVNLNDENNTQVYIQIDNNQQLQNLMGQHQVTQVGEVLQEEVPQVIEANTPPPAQPQMRIVHDTRMEVKQEDMEFESEEGVVGQPHATGDSDLSASEVPMGSLQVLEVEEEEEEGTEREVTDDEHDPNQSAEHHQQHIQYVLAPDTSATHIAVSDGAATHITVADNTAAHMAVHEEQQIITTVARTNTIELIEESPRKRIRLESVQGTKIEEDEDETGEMVVAGDEQGNKKTVETQGFAFASI